MIVESRFRAFRVYKESLLLLVTRITEVSRAMAFGTICIGIAPVINLLLRYSEAFGLKLRDPNSPRWVIFPDFRARFRYYLHTVLGPLE